jgi:hypothetical protein
MMARLIAIVAVLVASGCASRQAPYLVDANSGDIFGPLPTKPEDTIWINGADFRVEHPSAARLAVQKRLQATIIPEVAFTNAPIRQVLTTLERATGVPFVLEGVAEAAPPGETPPSQSGITFAARYVSAWATLRIVVSTAGLQYRIHDTGVIVEPTGAHPAGGATRD